MSESTVFPMIEWCALAYIKKYDWVPIDDTLCTMTHVDLTKHQQTGCQRDTIPSVREQVPGFSFSKFCRIFAIILNLNLLFGEAVKSLNLLLQTYTRIILRKAQFLPIHVEFLSEKVLVWRGLTQIFLAARASGGMINSKNDGGWNWNGDSGVKHCNVSKFIDIFRVWINQIFIYAVHEILASVDSHLLHTGKKSLTRVLTKRGIPLTIMTSFIVSTWWPNV